MLYHFKTKDKAPPNEDELTLPTVFSNINFKKNKFLKITFN